KRPPPAGTNVREDPGVRKRVVPLGGPAHRAVAPPVVAVPEQVAAGRGGVRMEDLIGERIDDAVTGAEHMGVVPAVADPRVERRPRLTARAAPVVSVPPEIAAGLHLV